MGDRQSAGVVGQSLKRSTVAKKFYMVPDVVDFISGTDEPSKVVNLACCHLRVSMAETIKGLERKFDAEEIESIVKEFKRRFKGEWVYFYTIGEAREEIFLIDKSTAHHHDRFWRKGFQILMKYCDVQEINAFAYMSKFDQRLSL